MDILNCSKGRKDYCRWCTNVASGQQIRSIAALEKCILVQKSAGVWFHWIFNKLSDGYGKSELPMEGPTKLIKFGHDISTYKPRIYKLPEESPISGESSLPNPYEGQVLYISHWVMVQSQVIADGSSLGLPNVLRGINGYHKNSKLCWLKFIKGIHPSSINKPS